MDDAHEDDTSPASDRCDLTAEVQLVQDPHVHFNVYMAGTRPLSYYEEALRTEFLALHIYLIRGVDVADIQAPPQNQAEALAFGLIGCGQATWQQIERLLGMLPSDKSLRWVQDDAGSMEVRPKRFTVGEWVRGPMTGVHIHARLYPWVVRALTDQLVPVGHVLETKVLTFSPDRGGQHCDSTTVCTLQWCNTQSNEDNDAATFRGSYLLRG